MNALTSSISSAEINDWLERHRADASKVGDHKTQRVIAALSTAPEMLAALHLGVAYDDLLRSFQGPRVIFDGDVKSIDAAYDEWVSATRAAVTKAVSP